MFIPFLLLGLGALWALEDPGDPKEANQTQIILKQMIQEIINSKISFSYLLQFSFYLQVILNHVMTTKSTAADGLCAGNAL